MVKKQKQPHTGFGGPLFKVSGTLWQGRVLHVASSDDFLIIKQTASRLLGPTSRSCRKKVASMWFLQTCSSSANVWTKTRLLFQCPRRALLSEKWSYKVRKPRAALVRRVRPGDQSCGHETTFFTFIFNEGKSFVQLVVFSDKYNKTYITFKKNSFQCN